MPRVSGAGTGRPGTAGMVRRIPIRLPAPESNAFYGDQGRPVDPQDGARARHDRAVRGSPGARRAWSRTASRRTATTCRVGRRVQGLHQRLQRDRRPEELRSEVVRRHQGRRLHRAAELLRAGRTVEYFRIPRDVLTVCLGKSTYARCGIIVNVTPFEPEWEGHVTHRDLEHHAAAGEDLRQRRHRAGAVLPERRAVRDVLRGQEGQVPGAARRDAAEDLRALRP